MTIKASLATTAFLASTALATQASATTLTFDSLSQPGTFTIPVGTSYTEQGFEFTGNFSTLGVSNGLNIDGPGLLPVSTSFTLDNVNGDSFTFDGFDFQDIGPTTFSITGLLEDNSTLTSILSSDGVFGTVESFSGFGSTLLQQVSFNFTGTGGLTDNFRVSTDTDLAAVPLPATALLLIGGLGGLAYAGGAIRGRREEDADAVELESTPGPEHNA